MKLLEEHSVYMVVTTESWKQLDIVLEKVGDTAIERGEDNSKKKPVIFYVYKVVGIGI